VAVFHGGAVSLRRHYEEGWEVRVIDCNECGATIKAADDEELTAELNKHMKSEHPDVEWDDEQASDLVSSQAYDATDS
jgi:predicted small metal-binding protein